MRGVVNKCLPYSISYLFLLANDRLTDLGKWPEKVNYVLPVVIRVDTALKNAIFSNTSLFDSSKKTTACEDIDQFSKEILGLNQWARGGK